MIIHHLQEQNLFLSSISSFRVRYLSNIHDNLSHPSDDNSTASSVTSVASFAKESGISSVERSSGKNPYLFICQKKDISHHRHEFNHFVAEIENIHGIDKAIDLFGATFHNRDGDTIRLLPSSSVPNVDVDSDTNYLKTFKSYTPGFEDVKPSASLPTKPPPTKLTITHSPSSSGNTWKKPLFPTKSKSSLRSSNTTKTSQSTPASSSSQPSTPKYSTTKNQSATVPSLSSSHSKSLQSLKDQFLILKKQVTEDSQSLSQELAALQQQYTVINNDIKAIGEILHTSEDTISTLTKSTNEISFYMVNLSARMDSNFLQLQTFLSNSGIIAPVQEITSKRKDTLSSSDDDTNKRTKIGTHSSLFSLSSNGESSQVTPTLPTTPTLDLTVGKAVEGEES